VKRVEESEKSVFEKGKGKKNWENTRARVVGSILAGTTTAQC